MRLRLAKKADAEALLCIYEQYIDTPITFEGELPTTEEFENRIADILNGYPYIVAEESGQICGYAYAHRFRERWAYQWGAELSIYLDQEHQSRGIGKKLYGALIAILKQQGIKMIYSGVTIPNEKSEKLHLSMGFTSIGAYHNAGYKCGGWHSVQWFEQAIGELSAYPEAIIPINQLPKGIVESALETYS